MLADLVREAFAGGLTANPANSANGRANARFEGLRTVANGSEASAGASQVRKDSRAFAEPESPASTHDSQDSQQSQGGDPDARTVARLVRLMRWGWPEDEAQALVQRLALRDVFDDRVVCADCGHYRPGRCTNHSQAGFTSPSICRDWAGLLQRCGGYAERAP